MTFKTKSLNLQAILRPRLRTLRWLVPLLLIFLVVIYETGPALWLYERWGVTVHTIADLLIFGTIGPIFAYILLYLLERWLDERDINDFQTHLLNQVKAEVQNGRKLNDDALQLLFAASILIGSFKAEHTILPSKTAQDLDKTEAALKDAMGQLRSQLLCENQN